MDKYNNSRFKKYMDELHKIVEIFKANGIQFIFFQIPLSYRIKNLSFFELERIEKWEFDFNNITDNDLKIINKIYNNTLDLNYLRQVYSGAKVYERNGIKYLADYSSKYINIIKGKRLTTDQPDHFNNTIYIFGQCTARGTGVEDKDTIASFLQRQMNKIYPGSYQIVNGAIGCGSDLFDDMEHMKKEKYKRGDIIILCTNLEIVPLNIFKKYKIEYYDLSCAFNRPHGWGEWFTDMTQHTNRIGNEVIADKIFNYLFEKGCFNNEGYNDDNPKKRIFIDKCDEYDSLELTQYVTDLAKYKKDGINGAIVMNCNPFTLGHQYLIKYASSMVDYLYIFVVQEDKSFFNFKDRYKLVKQGTKAYKNVIVIPSGSFIISAITFPGYFYKDYDKNIIVDTSKDIAIFGKYIAPALNISKRFAGEEPIDYVTRQYNNEMRSSLPEYGIEFIEVPRKCMDQELISASFVRKLIENKQWNKIEKLVPETTYKYIVERFINNKNE